MNHRWYLPAFVAVGALAFGACGDGVANPPKTTSSSTTAATTTGAGGAGGEATTTGAGGAGGMAGSGGMAGTGGAGGGGPTAEVVDCASASPATTVTLLLSTFTPNAVTIAPGEVVRFNNTSIQAHDSTSGLVNGGAGTPDGIWTTGSIAAGSAACVRINVAGTYPYFCSGHELTMQGTITVQ